MNYYRYFYGQNNANGSMPESDMVQPIEMTADTESAGPADDGGNAGISWEMAAPEMPGGDIEPPVFDEETMTPDLSGGGVEPPSAGGGTGAPDLSGGDMRPPNSGGGAAGGMRPPSSGGGAAGGMRPPSSGGGATGGMRPPSSGGGATGGMRPPISGGGTTTPDFSGGGIEPPIIGGGGMRPPIGNLPNVSVLPQVGLIPNFAPNTVQYTLRNCMNNLVYLRTRKGEVYWYYPIRMDFNKVYGYRWEWQNGWYAYDISYSDIWSAYCYIS